MSTDPLVVWVFAFLQDPATLVNGYRYLQGSLRGMFTVYTRGHSAECLPFNQGSLDL